VSAPAGDVPRDDALPVGKTCRDCAHAGRCVAMGFTDSLDNDYCDFIPVRFKQKPSKEPK
jgi:hypothetical protein